MSVEWLSVGDLAIDGCATIHMVEKRDMKALISNECLCKATFANK